MSIQRAFSVSIRSPLNYGFYLGDGDILIPGEDIGDGDILIPGELIGDDIGELIGDDIGDDIVLEFEFVVVVVVVVVEFMLLAFVILALSVAVQPAQKATTTSNVERAKILRINFFSCNPVGHVVGELNGTCAQIALAQGLCPPVKSKV